uniref:Uncharacterized protein n=1 Tax=Alexandrium andersonii TaxID=327968 RepID=A0A7S2C4S3_9DINO
MAQSSLESVEEGEEDREEEDLDQELDIVATPIEGLPGNSVVSGLVVRAETAERRAEAWKATADKAQAEVRKLRAKLHEFRADMARIEERAVRAEQAVRGAESAEAWASWAEAEERAVRAESEVLRLHCELEAFRTAMLGEDKILSSAPPPVVRLDEFETAPGNEFPTEYGLRPCCSYSCGCLRFSAERLCANLSSLLCRPVRWSRDKALHLAGKPAPALVQPAVAPPSPWQ